MIRLDHISIAVRDYARSRDWYADILGLNVEFELPDYHTAALQDDADVTLFVYEPVERVVVPASCALTFQIDDVEKKYEQLAGRGVVFEKTPQKLEWGYGAELRDPDGYLVRLWDERTMREKG